MKTIHKTEGTIYSFSAEHEPVYRAQNGESLTIETYDCFTDQIQSEDTTLSELNWDQINPATGPIYIEGAEPGDALKVTILSIETDVKGVMMVGPGLGVLGDQIEEMKVKVMHVRHGRVLFNHISLPVRKMIGVIGTAPAKGAVNCGTPGAHGGNMDNKMVTEGATLYLPVHVPGALFALGDLHAAMGDGEVSVSGVEVAGSVTVKLEVVKDMKVEQPILENGRYFTQIASAETLDEAAKLATDLLIKRLVTYTNLTLEEAVMLMSAVGNVEVCQMVDPLMTVRAVFPKSILGQLETTLLP
ncbi:acetamidase/formamidase family protein [Chryseomicrobium palamuruense]|uniref:Acetamidase/formamidase family protein n=1 Tax=Chryseomicrobium palamuruense TaxID=682973 RepID=A0ABV8UU53_9BACL